MTIKDRFLDYWNTDLAYDDYKYDISIFEQLIYGIGGMAAYIIAAAGVIVTVPLWGIPYLIYKSRKIKERRDE